MVRNTSVWRQEERGALSPKETQALVVNTNEFWVNFPNCWEVAQIKVISLVIYILFINHAIKPT